MTHGDVLDAKLPEATFESEDITERLRKLLEDESDTSFSVIETQDNE
jgi:hypothetical protein